MAVTPPLRLKHKRSGYLFGLTAIKKALLKARVLDFIPFNSPSKIRTSGSLICITSLSLPYQLEGFSLNPKLKDAYKLSSVVKIDFKDTDFKRKSTLFGHLLTQGFILK